MTRQRKTEGDFVRLGKFLRKYYGIVGVVFFSFALVVVFSVSRGAIPSISELAFIEYSPLGLEGGSVIPASCDSVPPTSHGLNDCTVLCWNGNSYDPYLNPGGCPAQPISGVCAATHYNCSAGAVSNHADILTSWTWRCNGANGGSSPSCSEVKPAPATPPNVLIGQSSCGMGRILIYWQRVNNATSYRVVDESNNIVATTGSDSVWSPSYPDGAVHSFRVRAEGNGVSPYSVAVQGTAPPACQPPPTLTATPGACGSATGNINLSWTPVVGVLEYEVWDQLTAGPPVYEGLSTSAVHSGLLAGSLHRYYVEAMTDTDSVQSNSQSANAPPLACPPPATPQNLSASAGSCGTGIALSWDPVFNAATYEVRRDNGVIILGITGTSYTDTAIPASRSHNYEVRARNSSTQSDWSFHANAISAPICVVPPLPPINVIAVTGDCGSGVINVSWGPSINAAGYRVYDGNTLVSPDLTTTSFAHAVSGMMPRNYTVRAFNNRSPSQPSSPGANAFPPQDVALCVLLANFTSGPVTLNTGALIQNTPPVTFSAVANNTGGGGSNGWLFSQFFYRWGGSGAWTLLGGQVGNNELFGNSSRTDISPALTLNQIDTLQIRHCVDAPSDTNREISETDNCATGNFVVACPVASPWNASISLCDAAPGAPVIDGPAVGVMNTPYTFGFTATDVDSSIRYEIDWDNNGISDISVPSPGFTPSGTRLTLVNQWASIGTKTFRARTRDSQGAESVWTSHTITLSLPPPPPPAVTLTGTTFYGGSSNTSVSAYYSERASLYWTATNNTTNCTIYQNGLFYMTLPYPLNRFASTTPLNANDIYRVDCTNGTLGTGNNVTFVLPPVPTLLSASCASPGTTATLNWSLPLSYTQAFVRVYKTPPSAIDYNEACIPAKTPPNGLCSTVTGNTVNMVSTPGDQYYWFINTRDSSGSASNNTPGGTFTCGIPPISIDVVPATYSTLLPTPSFTATYVLSNGTAGNTNCRLLNNVGVALTAYAPCTGSLTHTAPLVAGTYGYTIQANKPSIPETVLSNGFTVTVDTPVPILTTTPVNQLNFGDVLVGVPDTETFTITNTGQPGSSLTGVVTTGDIRFVCTLGCNYTNLTPASAPHTVTITSTPNVLNLVSTQILFNGINAPNPLTAIGNGVPVTISVPSAINFGSIPAVTPFTRNKEITFRIRNIGPVNLPNATFTGYLAPYTCVSVATCAANGINLAMNIDNYVTLRFTPTAAIDYPQQIGLLNNQPLYRITINGAGVPPVFNVTEE